MKYLISYHWYKYRDHEDGGLSESGTGSAILTTDGAMTAKFLNQFQEDIIEEANFSAITIIFFGKLEDE